MHQGVDSKIQARVRILLARRWVDLRSVTVGTTNGVVYLGGALRSMGGPDAAGSGSLSPRRDAWLSRLKREITQIPEVRDVVIQWADGAESGSASSKEAG